MEHYDELIEALVIGAALKDNAVCYSLDLRPNEFYVSTYAKTYEKIIELTKVGQVADPVTIAPHVELSVSDLVDMQDSGMSFSATKDYAEAIREYARKRSLAFAADEFKNALNEKSAADSLIILNKLLRSNEVGLKLKTRSQVRMDVLESLSRERPIYPTGLQKLDEAMLGGLHKGRVYGVCGAEKAGKTTFAHTISHNLAESGCKHVYVAMEMGANEIEQKNMAREAGLNSSVFIKNPEKILAQADGFGSSDNLMYLDCPGATLDEILFQISLAKARHGIDGFIVDYLGLIQGQNKADNEEQHLRRCAQELADFVKKNDVWCVVLAQMNKDGHLFGGNGLRKACDMLLMIEQIEGLDDSRWLRMSASRYTARMDIGSSGVPSYRIEWRAGPYVVELK